MMKKRFEIVQTDTSEATVEDDILRIFEDDLFFDYTSVDEIIETLGSARGEVNNDIDRVVTSALERAAGILIPSGESYRGSHNNRRDGA